MSKKICRFCGGSVRPITGGGRCSLCNRIRKALLSYLKRGGDPVALMDAYTSIADRAAGKTTDTGETVQ